jgi:arylsulfatase A-like enzyme
MLDLKYFILILLSLIILSCNSSSDDKPNIILIMADDMGFSDIGPYGGEIETPNLDRLASSGVRFSQFYNNARCCPTRASLLTGLYPHQTGLGHMVDGVIRDGGYYGEINRNCVTIAEVLGSSGYETYMSGKWHVSRSTSEKDKSNWPLQRGFKRFFGTITGAGSFYDPATLTSMNQPIKAGKGFYYTDAISDTASIFIKEHVMKDKDKPFFLYVSYTAPHWPLHAPDNVISKYEDLYLNGWDELRKKRLEALKEIGMVPKNMILSDRDKNVQDWKSVENKEWQARRMATYAAQIDIMDNGIGRIIRELEETGQLDNTIIFFLADNGGCAEGWNSETEWVRRYAPVNTFDGVEVKFGNTPDIIPGPDSTYTSYATEWANLSNAPFRWYKHYGHEGGVSSPFIMHWPAGIEVKNVIRNQVAGIIDIMSTIVDISGAEYPEIYNGNAIKPMEGQSLIASARFDENIERNAYYFEHEWNRYIRKGKWKLVALWNGKWELYDMETDRTETTNLASQFPELVENMIKDWEAWAWRTGVLPRPK